MVYKSNKSTKDGRRYFFRVKYKDIYGKTVDYTSSKFLTKKEATDEEAKFRLKINESKLNRYNPTFNDIYLEYLEKQKNIVKKQTLVRYSYLYKYLDSIKDIRINSFDFDKYKKFTHWLDQQNVKNEYKNKILNLIKSLIRYSNQLYNTKLDILRFINLYREDKIVKDMQFYTLDEYKQYRAFIKAKEWLAFFDTLYFLGLRKGEAQAITFSDIKNKELHITKTLTTKLKGIDYYISTPKTKTSNRILPIPDFLLEEYNELKEIAKQYSDYNDNWFMFGYTVPFKDTSIDNHNRTYAKLSDLKHIRIHDFRHSCATMLINKGASIPLVSRYLGHSNVSITLNVYSHFYKNELDSITQSLDRI